MRENERIISQEGVVFSTKLKHKATRHFLKETEESFSGCKLRLKYCRSKLSVILDRCVFNDSMVPRTINEVAICIEQRSLTRYPDPLSLRREENIHANFL